MNIPRVSFVVSVALFSLLPALAAQSRWTKLTPATSPAPRAALSGAADLTGLYVFGGGLVGKLGDDLWRFDGRNWTDLTANVTPRPPARRFCSVAYDISRQRLVLFGGDSATGVRNDTWEWNGTKWTNLAPAVRPSARRSAAIAYDENRKVVVLFGGHDLTTFMNDTWEWNGATWSKRAPATSPSARARNRMVYHHKLKQLVTFGGAAGAGFITPSTDPLTWTYDGTDWKSIQTTNSPRGAGATTPGLLTYGMSYDRLRDRVVLFGGYAQLKYQGNTWEFDGADWTDRGTTPNFAIRGGPAMAFVLGIGKTVCFGGFNGTSKQLDETWELQTNAFATFGTTGTGCRGTAGTPTLAAQTLPWLGTRFVVAAGTLPAAGPTAAVVGVQKTAISLAPFGAPGCTAYVSFDVTVPMTRTGSTATLTMPVPDQAFLIGLETYFQAAAIDGGANRLGVALSARGEAKFGAL